MLSKFVVWLLVLLVYWICRFIHSLHWAFVQIIRLVLTTSSQSSLFSFKDEELINALLSIDE